MAAAQIIESEITQGDTGPIWLVSVPEIDSDGKNVGDADLSGYSCILYFADSDGLIQQKTITATNTANTNFLVQMDSSETNSIKVGKLRAVIQVTDQNVPPYVSEIHLDLTVKPQRII